MTRCPLFIVVLRPHLNSRWYHDHSEHWTVEKLPASGTAESDAAGVAVVESAAGGGAFGRVGVRGDWP